MRYRCRVYRQSDEALLTIHYLDAPNEEAAEFAAREFASREFELPITGLGAAVEEGEEEMMPEGSFTRPATRAEEEG